MRISQKQYDCLRTPFKDGLFELYTGTSRSGKSFAVVHRAALFYSRSKDENHLILANNQDQAFRLMIDCDGQGLMHIFEGCSTLKDDKYGRHLYIEMPSGIKRIYYMGGGKEDSYKAFRGLSIGSVVFCEINLLHKNTIDEAYNRIKAAELMWTIADRNPVSPHDPIKKIEIERNMRVVHWNMDDNPIMSKERKLQIYEQIKGNKTLLDRDWYGKDTVLEGVIYDNFDFEDNGRNRKDKIDGDPVEMFFAADAGLMDATSFSCYIVSKTTRGGRVSFVLNRMASYYYSGSETGSSKAYSIQAKEIKDFIQYCSTAFIPASNYYTIFVDPSAKHLREELNLIGIPTKGAHNNAHDIKGSSKGIKVGIERLRSAITEGNFVCVDNGRLPPEYNHTPLFQEIPLYMVNDKTREPIDAHNHALDEVRYAYNYVYKSYGS